MIEKIELMEDRNSGYVFKGEDFYLVNDGHAWGMGSFNEYRTKSGIVGTEWSDCWWIWENGDFQVYNLNYSMNPEFQHDFVWVKTLEKI